MNEIRKLKQFFYKLEGYEAEAFFIPSRSSWILFFQVCFRYSRDNMFHINILSRDKKRTTLIIF